MIAQLSAELKKYQIPALYLSSFDSHLSEYVPASESLRLLLTGFTGSVAEVLVTARGEVFLFVDGRYHEQADLEAAAGITVEKVPYGMSLTRALEDKVKSLGLTKIAVVAHRTSLETVQSLRRFLEVISWPGVAIEKLLGLTGHQKSLAVEMLSYPKDESPLMRVQEKLAEGEAVFINALDSLAWILEARGYDYPYSSSFRGVGYITKSEAHAFLPSEVSYPERKGVLIHPQEDLYDFFKGRSENKVYVSASETNYEQYLMLEKSFTPDRLQFSESFIRSLTAIKTPVEMQWFEESYLLASRAIDKSIKWLKKEASVREVSELEFNQYVTSSYESMGMKGHSFKTISGFGPHGSIIHYSTPDAATMAVSGDLALLDSGAFFKGGFATDCTRTFLIGDTPSAKQRELYTRVLKGFIKAMKAVFPVGTWGAQIDALARADLRAVGLDFAHGTGHGIGVNVHEAGYRISPTSQIPLVPGVVGSIEPGVYLPGEGGIRLENVVIVEEHPTHKNFLRFKNLIWVPFEENLIMQELLSKDEAEWLDNYQAECLERL